MKTRVVLMCAASALVACSGWQWPGTSRGGTFRVHFTWESQRPSPDEVLWIVGRVTRDSDVRTVGPVRYGPGMQLDFKNVDNGDGLVVSVEFRGAEDFSAPVVYYGISAPFSLKPGVRDEPVDVRVRLRPSPDPDDGAIGVVSSEGVVGSADVTLLVRQPVGRYVRLSNVSTFPDDGDAAVPRTRRVELSGTADQAIPWNLDVGLSTPCAAPNVCRRRVFARFVDDEGYASRTVSTDVVLDLQPPALALEPDGSPEAHVTPSLAADTAFVTVEFTVDERALPTASVTLVEDPAWAFDLVEGPVGLATSTFLFRSRAAAGTLALGTTYTARVAFADLADNRVSVDVGTVRRDPDAVQLETASLGRVLADGGTLGITADGGSHLVNAGVTLRLRVTANKPLAAPPAMRLRDTPFSPDGGPTCTDATRTDCTGEVTVTADIPDGEAPVRVDLMDESGRTGEFVPFRNIVVDKRAPGVVPDLQPALVRPGMTVFLSAYADEPVEFAAVQPQLLDPAGVRHPVVASVSGSFGQWTFEVPEGALDGVWTLAADTMLFADRAGNVTALTQLPDFVVDGQAPAISGLQVAPARIGPAERAGGQLTATFQALDAPGGNLDAANVAEARFEGDAMTCTATGADWSCSTGIRADLPQGFVSLEVTLRDPAGNRTTAVATVPYDLAAPTLPVAELLYLPAPDNPVQDVTAARPDTEVLAVLVANEPVFAAGDAGPALVARGRDGGAIRFVADPSAGESTYLVMFRAVAGSAPTGDYALYPELTDLAGNPNDRDGGLAAPVLHVRARAPQLQVRQHNVALLRQPTAKHYTPVSAVTLPGLPADADAGTTTGGLGPTGGGGPEPGGGPVTVPGERYSEVTGSAVFSVVGSTGLGAARVDLGPQDFGFPAGAHVRLLRFWDWPVTAEADAGPLGSAPRLLSQVGWEDRAGAWQSSSPVWTGMEGRGVLVTAVDEAGNESTPVPLQHTELDVETVVPTRGAAPVVWQSGAWPPHPLPVDTGGSWGVTPGAGHPRLAGAADGALVMSGGTQWRVVEVPDGTPLASADMAGAYDPARDRLVLLAWAGSSAQVAEYDGSSWRFPELRGDLPVGLRGVAAAYDPVGGGVMFYGGCGGGNDALPYVWRWDGAAFALEAAPEGRAQATLVADPGRGAVVLVGGVRDCAQPPATFSTSTWEWNGYAWRAVPGATLSARRGAAGAWEPATGTVLVHGGTSAAGTPLADLWRFDGVSFAAVGTAGAAPARSGHLMVVDPSNGDLLLYGGSATADTLSRLRAGTWSTVATSVTPGPQPAAAGFLDPHRGWRADGALVGRLLLAGCEALPGETCTRRTLWAWSEAPGWAEVTPAPLRAPAGGRVLMVMGRSAPVAVVQDSSGAVQLWRGSAGAWTTSSSMLNLLNNYPLGLTMGAVPPETDSVEAVLVGPTSTLMLCGYATLDANGLNVAGACLLGPNPGRADGALALVDATGFPSTTFLFGGANGSGTLLDTTLTFNRNAALALWSDVSGDSPTRPPPRRAAAMAYFAEARAVVLYGGLGDTGPLADAWLLDPGTHRWVNATPVVDAPPARANHTLAYDPVRQALVVVGGDSTSAMDPRGGTAVPSLEVTWDGAALHFRALPLAPRPLALEGVVGAAYDPVAGGVLALSASGPSGNSEGTWILESPRHPAGSLTLGAPLSEAHLSTAHLREVAVDVDQSSDAGVPAGSLHAWQSVGPAAGSWQPLASGTVPQPARHTVRLPGGAPAVAVQVRAVDADGGAVAVETLQVRARFCQRADGGTCPADGGT
ncbi:MAG: hypothetical protein HY904_02005 [Deltaproteobacteria bacterium]|nr:hypothetical protein [Deltaproteobacteria bacterium]